MAQSTKAKARFPLATAGFAAFVVTAGLPATEAAAQDVGQAQAQSTDLFARDRAVSVIDRSRPEYDALGIPAGPFMAFPKVQVDAEHNDNVFAAASNTQSDTVFRVRPEVAFTSDWTRHYMRAYVRDTLTRHDKFKSENVNEWAVGANGRVDVTREINLTAGADYLDAVESRTSSNTAAAARDPITFSVTQSYLAATRTAGHVRLNVRADYRKHNYDDGRTSAGAVIEQDDRDHEATTLRGRADYAISPATAVFVQVTGNKRDYKTVPGAITPPRDSDGYESLVGVNFEVGAVMRGEFAVGYISQSYDNAAYKKIDGFGSRTQLEWFPTELTTVSGSFARTVEDAGVVGAAGYLSSNYGLGVDHELLRNLILSARVDYSRDKYNGLAREDDRTNATLRAAYLMNRRVGLSLTYSHLDQDSKGGAFTRGPSYNVNRVYMTLTAQF